MVEWILFLPILVLAAIAIVFRIAAPRISVRAREWLAVLLLLVQVISILVNVAPVGHRLVLSDWIGAGFTLELQFDGTALVFLLAIFLVQAALWLIAPPRVPFDATSVVVHMAAIALILAANLATIYFAWVLLDLAVFAWRFGHEIERENAVRALAVAQLAGLALFLGAEFLGTPYATQGIALIAIAFWARLSLFPFQWIYPMRGTTSRDLWTARGIPMLASATLWVRWPMLPLEPPGQLIAALATVALLAYAVWVWREEQPARAAIVSTWHAVAIVPLALAYGNEAGIAFALWLVLSAAVAIALFETALRWRAENRNRWARLVWFAGVFCVAGLPLTPAFIARLGLYVSLFESGNWWLLLLVGAVTTVACAPLWAFGAALEGSEDRDPTRSEYAGLGILAAVLVALGLAPLPIAQSLSSAMDYSAEAAMTRVVWTNDLLGISVAGVIVLASLFASFAISEYASKFRPQPRSLIPRLARAADLNWLEKTVTGVGFEMGAAARNISAIAEENPAVWMLLVALWIAIFVLFPR